MSAVNFGMQFWHHFNQEFLKIDHVFNNDILPTISNPMVKLCKTQQLSIQASFACLFFLCHSDERQEKHLFSKVTQIRVLFLHNSIKWNLFNLYLIAFKLFVIKALHFWVRLHFFFQWKGKTYDIIRWNSCRQTSDE